jgi:hypothetical protein
MEGFVRILTRRSLREVEDRDAYWLSKTPEERIDAVGMINLTIRGEKYAEQKLSRVCEVTRRQGR